MQIPNSTRQSLEPSYFKVTIKNLNSRNGALQPVYHMFQPAPLEFANHNSNVDDLINPEVKTILFIPQFLAFQAK